MKILVTEKLKNHRVGDVYFSYSINQHHHIEILSYIVENFQKVKFCGLSMHSKGAYLLDKVSVADSENDPLICLIDFVAAVLQNNVQVNTSQSYLTILSEQVRKEAKKMLHNISSIKVIDLVGNNISDCVIDDITLLLSNNELEEVYLGRNNLQEVGMIKIAEALQNNSILKVFDISNNSINDKAAEN